MNLRDKANYVIERIIEDIIDRRGLGDAWEEIDADVKDEITRSWSDLINDEFE